MKYKKEYVTLPPNIGLLDLVCEICNEPFKPTQKVVAFVHPIEKYVYKFYHTECE